MLLRVDDVFVCVLQSALQALWIMGGAGFGTAIGVHFPIGYTSASHLAPAFLGAIMFIVAMVMTHDEMMRSAPSSGFER